jgi:ATP-dependent helicase/nuclease subunit B
LRYYLKYAVGMQEAEPDRVEWNARDFGTVAHAIMERWGRDPDARNLTHAQSILDWLTTERSRIVDNQFGTRVPLAVRIQSEALHQRLAWLAQVQAKSRADGWEIIEIERKIEIPVGNTTLVAKIDRIDRHCDNGALRIIDYKTGKVKGVESEHRRKITSQTVIASHLGTDSPAVYQNIHHDKPVDFLWHNLQLPLYASAVKDLLGAVPTPCYFTLGATEADVAIHSWEDFSNTDLDAARACAEWIVGKISSGDFWPPAEKVSYDDFAVLAAGRTLPEMFLPLNPMGCASLNA